jgi:hypothetical protein
MKIIKFYEFFLWKKFREREDDFSIQGRKNLKTFKTFTNINIFIFFQNY